MIMQKAFIFILGAFMLTCCAESVETAPPPPSLPDKVDHILYASSTLEKGIDEIEALLGVRPVRGGRHPQYGTHNAILSLGESVYLEVIAPDPELEAPEQGRLINLADEASVLLTWVLRAENIETVAAKAASGGLEVGEVQSGKREKPDGSVLQWKLSDPYARSFDGAVPFLIAWGETPHPAAAAPSAGRLIGLRIEHPNADVVRNALLALDVEMDVSEGDAYRLIALIETKSGVVELK